MANNEVQEDVDVEDVDVEDKPNLPEGDSNSLSCSPLWGRAKKGLFM